MYWIQHPVVLEGRKVRLEPLQYNHVPALIAIASRPEIWSHFPIDGTDAAAMDKELRSAIMKRTTGEQYPFTIFEKGTNAIIGSTRLFDIFFEHKKLEIGWTWYAPAYWGSGLNTECKLLLLTYCFERLGAKRVQLKTRDTNLRSQAAIKKIGAVMEGTLRNDRTMRDGSTRHTVLFSIVEDEWITVKDRLQQMVAANAV